MIMSTMTYLLILSIFYTIHSSKIFDLDSEDLWSQHKNIHRLEFGAKEDNERKTIFMDNLKFIYEFNSKNEGFVLAMNKFGHLRPSEIKFGLKINEGEHSLSNDRHKNSSLPIKSWVDWREYSVVTNVKDQGECGSCYAFSAVGAIESQNAIRTGRLEELSEQEVVDCSKEDPNDGCAGGYPSSVFMYAMKKGLSLEKDYKYTASDDACTAKSKKHVDKLFSYVKIPKGDEKELVRVLSNVGPVSICFNANHKEFLFYKSGVLNIKKCDGSRLDHAVLAVGYNSEGPTPYLTVKNSWGSDWGEDGYFRITLYKNMCGVANLASYPIIDERK